MNNFLSGEKIFILTILSNSLKILPLQAHTKKRDKYNTSNFKTINLFISSGGTHSPVLDSLAGFNNWLILFTIQLNSRPYMAFDMASLILTASPWELFLIIVSPLATMADVVSASCNSLPSIPSKSETELQDFEIDVFLLSS